MKPVPLEECVCTPDEYCVMSSTLGVAVSKFSNCSLLVLDSFDGVCLHNQPNSLYGQPVCGNGENSLVAYGPYQFLCFLNYILYPGKLKKQN